MSRVKSLFYSVCESCVFGNILVAFCGITLSLSTYLILGISLSDVSIPALALIFFACLFIYNLNVFFLGEFDLNVARERWKSENLKLVKMFSVFCLLPVLFYAPLLTANSLIILSHLLLLAIFYIVPVKWEGRYYSFRKIPLLKLFVLSYVWSCVTVLLPAVESGINLGTTTLILFLERFIFILAISIPFDIRDFERDEVQGTLTIPVWLGKSRAKKLSLLLLIVLIFFSIYNYGLNFISVARILSGLFAMLFILNSQRVRSELFFLIILDGIMLIHFFIIWLVKTFIVFI